MKKSSHKALGCHVFAGGFTMGVRNVMPVTAQLEIHDFGRETVETHLKIPFINRPTWRDWIGIKESKGAGLLFGNPRCTGFSCLTGGYSEEVHGASAKCTQDIRDLCEFGVAAKIPVIIWESVQQAFTTGRPLIDDLIRGTFKNKGYRFAHLFINAASFGNAQRRKRYFFVAYQQDVGEFNVRPPEMLAKQTTVWDVIEQDVERETRPFRPRYDPYDRDCYEKISKDEIAVVPHLMQGQNLNKFGREREAFLKELSPKFAEQQYWALSDMPFSMHCINRLNQFRQCPTLHSGCKRAIHPTLNRPITVGEMSALMGWPRPIIPVGSEPVKQIVKGICPEVGEWLAQQAVMFLDGKWKKQNFEIVSSKGRHLEHRDCEKNQEEKLFVLTDWAPPKVEKDGTIKGQEAEEEDDEMVAV